MNSNGMDIVLEEDTLSWRITGGMLDLYILMGPTPGAVLEQLTRVIGRPALPPFWSLGFHQCKYDPCFHPDKVATWLLLAVY